MNLTEDLLNAVDRVAMDISTALSNCQYDYARKIAVDFIHAYTIGKPGERLYYLEDGKATFDPNNEYAFWGLFSLRPKEMDQIQYEAFKDTLAYLPALAYKPVFGRVEELKSAANTWLRFRGLSGKKLPKYRTARCEIYGSKDVHVIDGRTVGRVTARQYDELVNLAKRHPDGLTKDEVSLGVLRTLKAKPGWKKVVQFPGKAGKPGTGGYRLL